MPGGEARVGGRPLPHHGLGPAGTVLAAPTTAAVLRLSENVTLFPFTVTWAFLSPSATSAETWGFWPASLILARMASRFFLSFSAASGVPHVPARLRVTAPPRSAWAVTLSGKVPPSISEISPITGLPPPRFPERGVFK